MSLETNGNGIPATKLVGPASVGAQGMPYPVYMGQGGGGQGGNGMFGDQGAWWLVLVIIIIAALGGNWGGNNNGGGNGMSSGAPIIVNDGNGGSVQRGFDQAAVMSGLNGIQSGISGLSTQLCGCCCDMQGTVNNGFSNVQQSLCSGFAGVNSTVTGAQNALTQQMYTNTIADLERSFANQTAITQNLNGIQSQLAQCCCDNRMATNDLKYVIAQENCADRAAISDGIRDLLTAQTAGFQGIKDLLYQDRLDEKQDRIASLERQLTAAQLNASQIAQTAQFQRSQDAQTDAIYARFRDCPVPTMPVYGMTPIFTCQNNNNNGCGCGCNGGGFMN